MSSTFVVLHPAGITKAGRWIGAGETFEASPDGAHVGRWLREGKIVRKAFADFMTAFFELVVIKNGTEHALRWLADQYAAQMPNPSALVQLVREAKSFLELTKLGTLVCFDLHQLIWESLPPDLFPQPLRDAVDMRQPREAARR